MEGVLHNEMVVRLINSDSNSHGTVTANTIRLHKNIIPLIMRPIEAAVHLVACLHIKLCF